MFLACLAVCVGVSLATKPDDMEVLKKFYLKVRPWGFWGPVLAAARKDYPELKANTYFSRDAINVIVGIIWQTALVAAPIFMVIKHWQEFIIAMIVVAVTSLFLWRNWYMKLENYPDDLPVEYLPQSDANLK